MGWKTHWSMDRTVTFIAAMALLGLAAGCGDVEVETADASDVDAGVTHDANAEIPDADSTPDAAPSYHTLTVTLAGSGAGAVTSSPSGIDFGSDCNEYYHEGTTITLTATPSGSSSFGGWAGACSGTGVCAVTMDDAKSVTASFNPPGSFALSVTVTGTGTGTVTSVPSGIDCGVDCAEEYTENTSVTLTATPTGGSSFAGWSGACSGTSTCVVTVTSTTAVTATFDPPPSYTLSVELLGTGAGSVSSNPAGISCGGDCTESYVQGTSVTLTATESGDSVFAGWGGACSGTGSCVVTINAATSVTATFDPPPTHVLNVILDGGGTGVVTSNPAGINCGSDCSESYVQGTVVTLTANATGSSSFTSWSGSCSGAALTCQVTMAAARTVTATFAPPAYYDLDVQLAGSGEGWVDSVPAGIDCGTDCTHSYMEGTAVTLTAHAGGTSGFAGWSGACSGLGTCDVTVNAYTSVTATFDAANIAFITSTTHTGNLGGLNGADVICQARAVAADLPGTYRAYLSTSTVDAIDRLGSARGWVRTDGAVIFDTIADIANNVTRHPLRLDEYGIDLGISWTHTGTVGGVADTYNEQCGDWTSAANEQTRGGAGHLEGSSWSTGIGSDYCNQSDHLFCFGISSTVAVSPVQSEGRIAFVSAAGWASGGGIASADLLCQTEAITAGLSGSYIAALATDDATAGDRFNLEGAPWVRTDGVLIAPTAAGFFADEYLEAAANVTPNGNDHLGGYGVWSGTSSWPVSSGENCNNWTASDSDTTGRVGRAGGTSLADRSGMAWTTGCNATWNHLYCLQE